MKLVSDYKGMFKDIKAVIFDMDGTLIDSMFIWRDIDREFLAARGLSMPSDLQKCIEGMSFHETACFFKEKFNLTEGLDAIKEIWNNMAYERYAHGMKLKKGAGEVLRFCQENNISLGIATSNSRQLAQVCLENIGIFNYFDTVVTGCEVLNGKPKPDIYLKAAENLGVLPADCLVFEDIVMGIMAGKNAGMRTCAVYDLYSVNMDAAKREAADYYIDNYEVLFEK